MITWSSLSRHVFVWCPPSLIPSLAGCLLQALARQAKSKRPKEIGKELEYCKMVAEQRVQRRYSRHFAMCREISTQIIDLVTMVGEYRLLNEKYVTKLSLIKPLASVGECELIFF